MSVGVTLILVKFEFGKYGNHPAKLEESMKFGIVVYFYLYFTILRVPERSNETEPLILTLKGSQGPLGTEKTAPRPEIRIFLNISLKISQTE